MIRRKIYFRADASATIGYGHFIRTLALADMLKEDFDCTFFTVSPTRYQLDEMNKVCRYVALNDESKFEVFLTYLDGTEIVVLDNYFFTTDYQRQVKAKGSKLVCVDDMHDKHYVADVVINHDPVDSNDFDIESCTRLCLGLDYALLRAPFLKPVSETKRNNDIVVNFGGADPYGITERIVTMLLNLKIPYNIVVILGDKVYLSEDNRQKVTIRKNLSADQMATLFEVSAAGLLSASTVCVEALSRHLPLIVGYYVDNQKEFYNRMASSNYFYPLGLLQNTDSTILQKGIESIGTTQTYLFSTGIKERYIKLFYSL